MPRGEYERRKGRKIESDIERLAAEKEEAGLKLQALGFTAQSCARCHYFDVGSDPRYGACLRFPEPVPTRADRTKCGEFKG